MPKVIDVCTFNNEHELFEIRYNILKDFVDEFIVVEFDKTFSGKEKKYLFRPHQYNDNRIKYFPTPEKVYSKYKELAKSSPNTKGASHWLTEFCMKESVKDALTHLGDTDIVFIGDCDEVVEPVFYTFPPEKLTKYKLRVYTYYLNNRSSEPFWGTISARYGDIKNECLNHLRNNHERKNTINECGWHFTSMHHQLERKLTDSYTSDSYASPQVMEHLQENVKNNKDFLGRPFTYKIDETDLPQWLLDNKEKYKHLWRES